MAALTRWRAIFAAAGAGDGYPGQRGVSGRRRLTTRSSDRWSGLRRVFALEFQAGIESSLCQDRPEIGWR